MKEKPTLFSAPMVLAILAGKKKQTRRIIKPQPEYFRINTDDEGLSMDQYDGRSTILWHRRKMIKEPYRKGDVLWVRETFAYMDEFVMHYKVDPYYYIGYKADLTCRNLTDDDYLDTTGWNWEHKHIMWKPSIFMPKDASRIKLLIKNVRIERLQDISEEDAIAEGIEGKNGKYRDYSDKNPDAFILKPYDSYNELWAEINGIKSWNENPFVWVIEFERIEE